MQMFDLIMREIVKSVDANQYACSNHDVERAAYTAGEFRAYGNMLQMMGHKAEGGTYNDRGCSRIAYFKLNGKELLKNSEWQDAFRRMFH